VAPGPFVVYVGTHGDRGAERADVILPAAAYTEKQALWVNTEGRVQLGARASFPPGEAREDWAILRALSDVLGHTLPYDSLAALRSVLVKSHPHFQRIGQIERGSPDDIRKLAAQGGAPERAPFRSPVVDFYLTNPIARASAVMGECSKLSQGRAAMTTAAE
jgi:NADH-quinone oxidoreductase subunit G